MNSLDNVRQRVKKLFLYLTSLYRERQVVFRRAPKTYCYHFNDMGQGFVINEIEGKSGYYHMTAQCTGVKLGDYIEIVQAKRSIKYQVEYIDYYSEPSDMWIGVLNKVSH